MGAYGSLADVKNAVEGNDGLLTVTMEELRDAVKAKRLGKYVRQEISDGLGGFGVGHVGEDLPEYQENPVRLYKLGSPAARLINAVMSPSASTDNELRSILSDESKEIVRAIRSLVSE